MLIQSEEKGVTFVVRCQCFSKKRGVFSMTKISVFCQKGGIFCPKISEKGVISNPGHSDGPYIRYTSGGTGLEGLYFEADIPTQPKHGHLPS